MQIGAVSSENSNLTSGANAAGAVDYSYQPHGPSEADSNVGTMSFDDFLDMVNPLEHIPLVSSIYRAVAGETINPVSRIAGDALYGGIFGLASAGISALGAAADEVVAELNGGQSASSYIVASLFGDDKTDASADTQLAAADTPSTDAATTSQADAGLKMATDTPNLQVASLLQTPARQSPILSMPDFSDAPATQVAATAPATTSAAADTTATPALAMADSSAAKGLPIDRSKMAYGGVLDTSNMLQNAQQNQALALALTSSQNNLQAQRAIRSNRFAVTPSTTTNGATGPTPADVMNSPLTAPVASLSIPGSTSATQIEPKTQAAMDNLLHELQSMKAINQYKSTSQNTPNTGENVNVTN